MTIAQKSLKSVSKEPLERLFTRATERLQGNLLILHQNSPLRESNAIMANIDATPNVPQKYILLFTNTGNIIII